MGLPADDMAMALLPEELPLQPEERLVAVKTTGNGDCLYNAVSLVMDGTESNASLLRLLVALELLLNMDFYIHHPRLTSFSNTDSHHPDTLFSLCLTTNSDQVFHDKSRSREEAICLRRVLRASHTSGVEFFILWLYQAFYVGLFFQHTPIATLGFAIFFTVK